MDYNNYCCAPVLTVKEHKSVLILNKLQIKDYISITRVGLCPEGYWFAEYASLSVPVIVYHIVVFKVISQRIFLFRI